MPVALSALWPPAFVPHTSRVVKARASKGFQKDGASEPSKGIKGSSKDANQQLKLSKRGKIASRPSQQKQLEQLQADEREYQRAMQQRIEERRASAKTQEPSFSESNSKFEAESEYESQSQTVPEQITDRMLRRMLAFSIGPVFFGFTLFPLFYYLKTSQGVDIPVWAVYLVQTMIFGGGLLGISYGILSSSWDPQREGSRLGWNEFQANLPIVLQRFKNPK